MSMSKLESLPNEILIDIFEKYMNGVDILTAFAYLQNKRFDALISQCQRFSFNFLNCRKDYFSWCISRLAIFDIEKIEELVLSDRNTPDQIRIFFALFPSFFPFKRLRKLYLQFNGNLTDWLVTKTAIYSLSNMAIDTLSIEIMNIDKESILHYTIDDIIRFITIKRLFLTNIMQYNQFSCLTPGFSRVEYFTNSGMLCTFQQLPRIFQGGSRLKYLNIQLTSQSFLFGYGHTIYISTNNTILIPTLHTFILSFEKDAPTTFDILVQYLNGMPALRRLEIKAHNALLNAPDWETLLQTSLPLLTHFRLKTTTSRIKKIDIENVQASFETPFWIEKENFYLIITEHKYLPSNRFSLDKLPIDAQDEFSQPVTQWWIVPMRTRIDDIPTNDIRSLAISGVLESLSQYYYFKNVRHLVIYNLDNNLLEWLLTYVNYPRIDYLDVSLLRNESSAITSLLSSLRNITSLRIQYSRLLNYQNAYLKKDHCVKYLDISVDEHRFVQKDLIIISQLFPDLEHLALNTKNLPNIPIWKSYLPDLCSVTFKARDDQFQEQMQFSFQRDNEWITVWIDQVVLEDPYWQKVSFNSSMSNTTSERPFPFSE